MSEPTDQNNADPMDDKDLSALYARGSTEQPSAALDQAILNKARQVASQQASKTKDRSSWSQAFSVAAVLMLSVTLVTLIRQEAPEPTSITSRPALMLEQEDALEDAQERASREILASKPMAEPAKQQLEKQKADTPLAESFALKKETRKERIKEEAKVAKAQEQHREEERELDKRIAASPALALKQQAPAQEVPAADAMSPARMASGVISDSALGFAQEGKSCDQLTEQECFTSAACTLTRNETADGYQCRPAKDHCELLFRQSDGTRESCEAKTGCVFVPASCYCPPNTICVCGGGEPAQCQSREE